MSSYSGLPFCPVSRGWSLPPHAVPMCRCPLRIEIEGGSEIPVLDGSAEGWVEEVFRAGLKYATQRPDLPVQVPIGALEPLEPIDGFEDEGEVQGEEEEEVEEVEEGEEDAERPAVQIEMVPAPLDKPVPKMVLRPQKVSRVVGRG